MMSDYIMELRKLVGVRPLILPGANVILLDNENRVLLHHRRDMDLWGLPGGFCELGETVEQTASREVKEEVGLICNKLKLFNVYSGEGQHFKYPHGDEVYNVTSTFICTDFEGTIKVDETEGRDARFFSFDEMPSNITAGIKAILNDYINNGMQIQAKSVKLNETKPDETKLNEAELNEIKLNEAKPNKSLDEKPDEKPTEANTYETPAINTIYERRSIRRYLDKPVEKDLIITLLKAATAAPTAVSCQPWEFIVADEEEKLAILKKELTFARYNAPIAIIVCGNMKLTLKGPDHDMWIQDCSAATENILIAAASLGLGTVWIGIYPVENRINLLKKVFNIPEHVIPLNIIYVGHPAENPGPRTRYDEKRVYWQEYEPKRKHRTKNKPSMGHH